MKYYVNTIEQTKIDEKKINEYAGVKIFGTLQEAEVEFYKRLMEVTNALGKTHTYMSIKIVNSYGVVVKEDTVGNYVTEEVTE